MLSRICLSHILQIEDTTASGVEKDVCNLILLRFEMRNQIVLHCGISGRECRSAIKTLLLGMGPSTCSLGARSVLSVFGGARAKVLKSEHMLGSLVLGLDARA